MKIRCIRCAELLKLMWEADELNYERWMCNCTTPTSIEVEE